MQKKNDYIEIEDLTFENEFYLNVKPKRLSKFITRLDLYRRIMNLRGEVVECGIFKAVSFMQFVKIRSILENDFSRKIIGLDTFGTFPNAKNEGDKKVLKKFVSEAGNKSISIGDLKKKLLHLNLEGNIELVKGDIQHTAKLYLEKNPGLRIALLHIDVDLYEPTKCSLEMFSHMW